MKALYTTEHIFTKKALYILQNKKDLCKSIGIVEYIVLKKIIHVQLLRRQLDSSICLQHDIV